MKKKQNELLKFLDACRAPQKSTEIANALQISPRSVKTYVAQINSLYNKKIILSSRNGYELNHSISNALFLDADNPPHTPDFRRTFLLYY